MAERGIVRAIICPVTFPGLCCAGFVPAVLQQAYTDCILI